MIALHKISCHVQDHTDHLISDSCIEGISNAFLNDLRGLGFFFFFFD